MLFKKNKLTASKYISFIMNLITVKYKVSCPMACIYQAKLNNLKLHSKITLIQNKKGNKSRKNQITFLCCFLYIAVQVSLEGFKRLWKYLLHFELAKRKTFHYTTIKKKYIYHFLSQKSLFRLKNKNKIKYQQPQRDI